VKRMTMLAVVLALVLAVTVPAVAEVSQAPAGTFSSGTNVNDGGAVTSDGNSANACGAQQGFDNTGGDEHQPEAQDYVSKGGKPGGRDTYNDGPKLTGSCKAAVLQGTSSDPSVASNGQYQY